TGDHLRAGVIDGNLQELGGTPHDREQVLDAIEVERVNGAKAVTQGGREHPLARRGADHGKSRELQPERLGAGTFATHEIELEVLHRRIQRLLDRARQAVDLVDKEDVAILEVGEDGCQRPLVLDRRTGGGADVDLHLIGHDVGQRGLPQARRPGDQDVLDGLVSPSRGADQDLEVGLDVFLPDELGKPARAQAPLEFLVFVPLLSRDNALRHPRSSPLSATVTSCSTEWPPPLPPLALRTASLASAGLSPSPVSTCSACATGSSPPTAAGTRASSPDTPALLLASTSRATRAAVCG